MLLAGAFRLIALGAAPPGLYRDEAFYGLDALSVLGRAPVPPYDSPGLASIPVYFPANHGREPLFIYLVALSIGVLGPTPLAVRLPSALVGTLTIPATYWMARELWGRRVGLITATLMAVTLWPVHLSRIGFRAVTLPLVAALGIGLTVRAWRSDRRRDWLFAGAMWGLAFYTYLAARFVPLLFILFAGFLLLFRRIEAGPFLPQRLSIGAVWATVGLGLVAAPLAIYTLGNWDVVMGRPGGVSILEPGINQGDFPGTLIGNTLKALGMFVWQGDRIPRHNAPWRPVFDPLLALSFLVGLVVLVRQARQRISAVFVLTWIGVMLLPTILSEDTPHFLRAVGVLPVAMIVPALGLDWLAEKIRNHRGTETRREQNNKLRVLVSWWLIIGVIAISAVWTMRDYAPYATSAETGYAFEAGAVELADTMNRFSVSGFRIIADDVYLREWTAIPFVLQHSPDVLISSEADLPPQPDAPALLAAWPYADWLSRLKAWPAPIQIQVQAGPMVKGDRDPQPYAMAVLAQIEPRHLITDSLITDPLITDSALATFDGGIRLLGYKIDDRSDEWRLRTLWQIEQPVSSDVTIFVHLLSEGASIATADGDAGDGLYPMRAWRVGDVIIDERRVPLPPDAKRAQLSMEIGLYDRQTTARVKVIETPVPVSSDALQLGAPGSPGP